MSCRICGRLIYRIFELRFGAATGVHTDQSELQRGEIPFNSSHLLGIANSQNDFISRNPKAATSGSPQDIFARQLQSRLLSALSGQIVDAVFGPNAQQSGTVDFGGQTIAWNRDLENVTLTITNDDTGARP